MVRGESSRSVFTKEEWEKRLASVNVRKEEMNALVMNYLVTEVC